MERDNVDRNHVFRPVSARCTNHNAPLHASHLTCPVYIILKYQTNIAKNCNTAPILSIFSNTARACSCWIILIYSVENETSLIRSFLTLT